MWVMVKSSNGELLASSDLDSADHPWDVPEWAEVHRVPSLPTPSEPLSWWVWSGSALVRRSERDITEIERNKEVRRFEAEVYGSTKDRKIVKLLFELSNRVRALEGLPPVQESRFLDYVKGL